MELDDLVAHSHQTQSAVPIDQALFQPNPPTVTFDSYEPCKVYTTKLLLKNMDKASWEYLYGDWVGSLS